MPSISDVFRKTRTDMNFTQAEFADLLGVSAARVCDLERGRRGLSVKSALAYSRALGLSPAHFVQAVLEDRLSNAGLEYTVKLTARRWYG